MSYTEAERQRIAEVVRRTRIDKQLDKEPAARAAKVNSITWKRVEDAQGVRDASLSKILSSLGLPDVDTILNPHQPNESATSLAHQLFHPSRRPVTKPMVANDPEMARVLEDLLSRGTVDESDRPIVERALEDARIAGFPAVFESLSRPGKLEVARFGAVVQASEIKQRHMEDERDDMETASESDASGKAQQVEEDTSDDVKRGLPALRPSADALPGEEPGADGDQQAGQGH